MNEASIQDASGEPTFELIVSSPMLSEDGAVSEYNVPSKVMGIESLHRPCGAGEGIWMFRILTMTD